MNENNNYVEVIHFNRDDVNLDNKGWLKTRVPKQSSYISEIRISDDIKLIVSSEFIESFKGWIRKEDYNNKFKITLENYKNLESFDYTISIVDTQKGKIALNKNDHICAIDAFIGDAIVGLMTFDEFMSEFGYKCTEGYCIWNKCKDATLKTVKLGLGDLHKISEYMHKNYEDVL